MPYCAFFGYPRPPSSAGRVLLLAGSLLAAPLLSGQVPLSPFPEVTALERAFALDEGAARNPSAVAALYREAAEAGDSFAHLRLGFMFETGEGVPQSYAEARQHYQTAVDAGLQPARLRLAICHLEGWGGPVDRAAFVRELRLAGEAGYVPAQRVLARVYLLGIGVPADRAESVRWLERAAAEQDPLAQYGLGRLSERAQRLALEPDLKLSRNWYELSAEQEYLTSMRAMARTFLTGPKNERNWALGQQWLTLATDSGDAEAPYILGMNELTHPDAPQRDIDRARAWLKLASERGNPRASEVLQLEIGEQSLVDAARYVLKAPFDERYMRRAALKADDGLNRRPVPYRMARPVYPEALRMSGTTGEVMLVFTVDTTGRVIDPKVVTTSHPLFSDRAVEAILQWRFSPAQKDGRLVKARLRLPVKFEITAEQLKGVDGMLQSAAALARRRGPEIAADARDLRMAEPTAKMQRPIQPNGQPFPSDGRAVVLLVLDPTGHPLRGHVLESRPEALGVALLATAMNGNYKPRMVNGEAVASSVILPYAVSRPAPPTKSAPAAVEP